MTRNRLRRDRFARWLTAIAALGLLVRVTYVAGFRRNKVFAGDAYFYHSGANLLVHGYGFIAPVQYLVLHIRLQAADHPPLYILFLAIPSALGLGTTFAHMLWSSCLGAATVALTGLVGRRVAGDRAGLIAAVFVAISPNLWVYDGSVLSETMAIFVATLALLLAYRAWDRATVRSVCALGVACGFAMLARSELILLVPAILWPVALLADHQPWRARLARTGAATLVACAIVTPWVVYNVVRFEHPVFLSSQLETTLAGANCNDSYHGTDLGLFTQQCLDQYPHDPHEDESRTAEALRRGAEHYIRTHLGRLPVVMAARVGRVLGAYRPAQQINLDVFVEGRERPLAVTGLFDGYATALAAIAGAVVLYRRRGPPLFPLGALPAIVLVTVAATYATDRFRATAETALAILAAVAIDAAMRTMQTQNPAN